MNPLDQLENEVTMSVLSRDTIAEKYASSAVLCVFMVCVTVLVLGLVAILHGG